MPRFILVPTRHHAANEDFVAHDAGQVLSRVQCLGWEAADVWREEKYLYSIAVNRQGVWSIRQRKDFSTSAQRAG